MSDYEPDWTQEKAPNAIGGRVAPPAAAEPEEPDEVPTIRDPHHDGYTTWKCESGRFWNRPHEGAKWREVKRIHATPARILALASLVNSPPAAEGQAEPRTRWVWKNPLKLVAAPPQESGRGDADE